jgi:cupin 2 domain-containing protein
MMALSNIFADVADEPSREQFNDLLRAGDVRIERIVSHGQASPPGFWYDQDWGEWVLVLQGSAGLRLEGEAERRLHRGDFLHIPPHVRHRVEWTDADGPTIWLAVHHR